jgi:hypothetical protein
MKALWLYFDVPYEEGATKMRGLLAYDVGGKISVLKAESCKDIPETVQKLETLAKQNGIVVDNTLTAIYPQDHRHGIAWPVKEKADERGWQFSRQIPIGQYPDAQDLILYSPFDNGSLEMNFDLPSAKAKVLELNAEARNEFSDGDMLPVMGKLRHAMYVSVRYFGWTAPPTVYTLRNFLAVLQAVGNSESENEGIFLVKQFIYAFMHNPPEKEEWEGSAPVIESLAQFLQNSGQFELAVGVRALMVYVQ